MKSRIKFLQIEKNEEIAPGVFEMVLSGDDFSGCKYGQFINIELAGTYLRRPISFCKISEKELVIAYRVVGRGTEILSKMGVLDKVNCFYPLGNGFSLPDDGQEIVLIGGGIGVPPLVGWYKKLVDVGFSPQVILGVRNKEQIIYADEFDHPQIVLDDEDKNMIE
jgi:dihydroorotate dehydrogenase electron transfer subunit